MKLRHPLSRLGSILLASALMAGVQGVGSSGTSGRAARAASLPPNIVFIMTDDQRWDSLRYMPNVRRYLADEGVEFTNAYVSNGLCCPSRATNLTGDYSHTTGVWRNIQPYGGFLSFDDSSTLATWLNPTYKTALMGKYLNFYTDASYVPPGWDSWFGYLTGEVRYYSVAASVNGVRRDFLDIPRHYTMRVLQRRAVAFIKRSEEPFFLFLSTTAPHQPSTPDPADTKALAGWVPHRPISYNEADVSDKPSWVQALPLNGGKKDPSRWDEIYHEMARTLLSVDRSVGKIVETLEETGELTNTLIIFTSDNGLNWGEHRWFYKDSGFEETIRVPLVVRYDALITTPRTDDHLVVNIDNAPTIAEAAGVSPTTDGESYLSLLGDPSVPWRDSFLMEHMVTFVEKHPTRTVPSFCGVHTKNAKYIEYVNGEKEMYDLVADPFELENLADDPSHSAMQATLDAELTGMCQPIPLVP